MKVLWSQSDEILGRDYQVKVEAKPQTVNELSQQILSLFKRYELAQSYSCVLPPSLGAIILLTCLLLEEIHTLLVVFHSEGSLDIIQKFDCLLLLILVYIEI